MSANAAKQWNQSYLEETDLFSSDYLNLARKIKSRAGIFQGTCIDVGSREGYLGIAMAKVTKFDVFLLRKNKEEYDSARSNIIRFGLKGKVQTLWEDVYHMSAKDMSVDLVVSKDAFSFKQDCKKAFEEIYRILVPGGIAYVGGNVKMWERQPYKYKFVKSRVSQIPNRSSQSVIAFFENAVRSADIPAFEFNQKENEFWIIIEK